MILEDKPRVVYDRDSTTRIKLLLTLEIPEDSDTDCDPEKWDWTLPIDFGNELIKVEQVK